MSYTLELAAVSEGKWDTSGSYLGEGSHSIPIGTSVSFRFIPNAGYTWSTWKYWKNGVESALWSTPTNPDTFMSGTANMVFKIQPVVTGSAQTVELNYLSDPDGVASLINNLTTQPGTTITFNKGGTVVISAPSTYSPPEGYTLSVNVMGWGSVTKTPDKPTYAQGEQVTLAPVVDSAHTNNTIFYEWQIGSQVWRGNSPLTVTVNSNISVDARFAYVVGGINTLVTAEQNGLYFYDSYDGTQWASSSYKTNIFLHGPKYGDYPIIRVAGTTTTKPMYSGITVSNVIADDDWYGAPYAPSTFFGVRGSFPTSGFFVIQGSGNSIRACTVRNTVKYGFTTYSATNFYIGDCYVEDAQYCVSGSGGRSTGGLVENNHFKGATIAYIKVKCWHDVTVRKNYSDVTPPRDYRYATTTISSECVNFSDDNHASDGGTEEILNVIIEDNDFIKEGAGVGTSIYAGELDAGCVEAGGNQIRNNRYESRSGAFKGWLVKGKNTTFKDNAFKTMGIPSSQIFVVYSGATGNTFPGNTADGVPIVV